VIPSPDWEVATAHFLSVPPTEVLIASDYDGTIAPIVEDPDEALPLAGIVGLLGALVPLVRRVAIISGRSERSLRRLLPVPGLIHIGENGVGETTPSEKARLHEFQIHATAMAARWPGVMVEAKPASVSVHFRAEPQVAAELERGLSALIAGSGLTLVGNRRVFDIQLRRAGKVRTMGRLLHELRPAAVLYAGDSRDDARVHRCLAHANVAKLCIALRSDEIPERIFRSADVALDGPRGFGEMLGFLLRRWNGPAPGSSRD